jgi:hypothetical protein
MTYAETVPVLDELGLRGEPGLMLVAPPDSVLAEAGRLSPRPSVAPSLRHAEPSRCIVWWPERELLTPAALSRLHWMVAIGQGEAWMIADPDDDEPLSIDELRDALAATQLVAGEERRLQRGGTALHCTPR